MNGRYVFHSIVIILFCSQFIFGYQKEENLEDKKEYRSFEDTYFDFLGNGEMLPAKKQADRYLKKAKELGRKARIAQGFYLLAKVSENDLAHSYHDSIILITKGLNHPLFPLYAYRNKADLYYKKYNFKKAFDFFLKASEEAKKQNNDLYYHLSIVDMVVLKAHVGEYESSFENLKKSYAYFDEIKNKRPRKYCFALFALSDSYIYRKKQDSASLINTLGYRVSKSKDLSFWQWHFTLNEGINQYYKDNYKASKDSITKFISKMATTHNPISKANMSMGYFYLGKTLEKMGNSRGALKAHKKVDEIYQEAKMAIPQIRYSYDVLIDHYKKLGDKDNHLRYIERRLAIDSSLTSDYRYLIKNVVQKYDTPKLLSEKQEVIDSLQKEKKSSTNLIVVLLVVSVLFLAFWVHNYLKKRDYKQKFDQLYNETIDQVNVEKPVNDVVNEESLGIAQEIIEDILEKLEEFEQNFDFLKSDITTNSLSKQFNTNYKYLSKIVNRYKGKTFSTYINDLRIEYSVIKLKEDKKFKNYTMQAIANEIGFNTSQAFSKSFYKKNGIHPSYFIKELQKKEY